MKKIVKYLFVLSTQGFVPILKKILTDHLFHFVQIQGSITLVQT